MASFAMDGVINSFPIFANTIDEERPGLVGVSQQLLVFFRVHLWLGTLFNDHPSIFLKLVFLWGNFGVTNRSHILQSGKQDSDF